MNLTINGDPQSFNDDPPDTVGQLLKRLDIPAKRGVAVAQNDAVIPRSQWDETPVEDGDRLEIIQATQGG